MYWSPQKLNHKTYVGTRILSSRKGQTFYDKPAAGKYNDHKNLILIEWYLKHTFNKDAHPKASLSSTAGAAKLKQTRGNDEKRSNTKAMAMQVGIMLDEEDFVNMLDP